MKSREGQECRRSGHINCELSVLERLEEDLTDVLRKVSVAATPDLPIIQSVLILSVKAHGIPHVQVKARNA
jgi:hypothetical protein